MKYLACMKSRKYQYIWKKSKDHEGVFPYKQTEKVKLTNKSNH